MLSVVRYRKTPEVFELGFLGDISRSSIVICPSPLLADDFRLNYHAQLDADPSQKVDIVTISKFMGDELSRGFEEVKTLRKAELLLHLGSIWKKYFAEAPQESFFQAFNLFTELRSFTLELNLIQDVFENFDETIASAIKVFWLYMQEAEMVDEHVAYQKLAEAYRSNDHQVHQYNESHNLIFWGFGHMSGGQVDLLQALGIRHDVYIPYPDEVWLEAGASDWVRWFDVEDSGKKEETEVESIESNLRLVNFSKSRLGESLLTFAGEHLKGEKVDIFLAQKNPNYNQLNEIPFSGFYYKTKSDMFSQITLDVLDDMRDKLFRKNKENVSATTCVEFLQDVITSELKEDFKNKNFRKIKALSICQQTIEEMLELSDENQTLSTFDIKILEQVCLLKLPRTFNVPLNCNEIKGHVRGIEGIESFSSANKTIVCASSDYQSVRGTDNIYDEKTIEFLTSVGPVKRQELEYLLTKKRLLEVLSSENTFLFLETGLVEHDLAWSEIINSFSEVETLNLKRPAKTEEGIEDILSSYINKKHQGDDVLYSATRLQSFIDCPRSYYFKYIDKIIPRPTFEKSIRPDQLGTLEHFIIREYLETTKVWDANAHRALVDKALKDFIQKEKKVLDPLNLETARLELLTYSQNGIRELLSLLTIDPNLELLFETELDRTQGVNGSVDCLVRGSFGTAVIDFKRSVGGIPSGKEIDNFDKIQLWFYLNYLPNSASDYSFWGYLNLASPTDSKIFGANPEIVSSLKELGFIAGKTSLYKNDLELKIDQFAEFKEELVKNIESEEEFLALPRKADSCTFCSVSNICPRTTEVKA